MSPLSRALVLALALLSILSAAPSARAEFGGPNGVLPAGSELDDEAASRKPSEVFHSEAIQGRKSYMVRLGDLAFSAPSLLGGAARQAGMSCDTCHVNGTSNPRLFVTGMSSVPGTFDTTGPLFNPKADDGIKDPVTVPSLRGARFLAPYGHDGRIASLREFVRNVIVNEFSGPEPSPEILDAVTAYIQDIDFLPNPRLELDGKLKGPASESEKRGEALFAKPFTHDPSLSCAGCHMPSAGFTDHRQHDVGSMGLFKTPTLLNANFNGPYFHDGRYGSYEQVVIHFDRLFYLGLSAQDRQDLVAYLKAVGDGEEPYIADNVDTRLKEIADFTSVLDTAIPGRDTAVVALAQDTIGGELRDFAEGFPERKDPSVSDGKDERAKARGALKEAVLALHGVGTAAASGNFDAAAAALANFRALLAQAQPLLKAAEPFSIYNPQVRAARLAVLRTVYQAAFDPATAPRRVDND
jgi:cytochrome c peroxidase